MAVEARHLSFFTSQLVGREMMNASIEGNADIYGNMIEYHGLLAPLSGTTTAETILPMYGGSLITEYVAAAKTSIKADSGLTYALPVSRSRSRDAINPLLSFSNEQIQNHNRCGSFTFLGEDIWQQIQHQQFEIDCFIAQHTEKLRLEMEERRKSFDRKIMAAVEEGIMKKLRAKDYEIEKLGKLNWALEEKIKSLCIENQIWKDLAQTNEATANALRSNLVQVLAQVKVEKIHRSCQGEEAAAAALLDDALSCCGSNYGEERRTISESGGERKLVMDKNSKNDDGTGTNHSNDNCGRSRLCRNCGKNESCVLLLPCRHLCLCTVCGSSVHICPVCKSTKNASVHVNLSS